MMLDLFTESGATFSDDRCYRYLLWRIWDASLPPLNFLMLNPSTADAVANDPTVERCERRARDGGFGGLLVTNLFALRSTDPRALYLVTDPVGPENDTAIQEAAQRAGMVVCAWGTHGALHGRGQAVIERLTAAGIDLYALMVTTGGFPAHPLYLSYELTPYLVWKGEV